MMGGTLLLTNAGPPVLVLGPACTFFRIHLIVACSGENRTDNQRLEENAEPYRCPLDWQVILKGNLYFCR